MLALSYQIVLIAMVTVIEVVYMYILGDFLLTPTTLAIQASQFKSGAVVKLQRVFINHIKCKMAF